MQSFLKVKKNIPGRDEKSNPLKSTKQSQSSSAGTKSVSETHSTIHNKGIGVEISNAILANPASAGRQTDSLDTAIIQGRRISPSLLESRLSRRETTNVNTEVATVSINTARKVIENSVDKKVSLMALTNVSKNSGLLSNVPSELENEGDSDKENQPEIGSKKRKDSVSIPLLVTAGQKKFKTAVVKSPSFAQFGTTVTSLPLPDCYNKLIHLFNQFDNTVVYLKQKNQNCVFHNIRRIVEVNANRTFAIEDFRKILTVEPDLYVLRPYHIVNQDIDTFIIDFRETENIFDLFKLIPSRRLEFEKKLLTRAKQYHQDFLQQNSLQWEFDKLKLDWHPKFDVNVIPDIEMAPLPFGKKIGYLEKWKELNSITSTPATERENNVVSSLKPSNITAVDDKTAENGASETEAPKKLSRAATLLEKVNAYLLDSGKRSNKEARRFVKAEQRSTKIPVDAISTK